MKPSVVAFAILTLVAAGEYTAISAGETPPPPWGIHAQRGVTIRPARIRVGGGRGYENFFGFTTYTLTEASLYGSSASTTEKRAGKARRADYHPDLAPFVYRNFDRISEDMAKGAGQHLITVANLLGCPPGVNAEFGWWAQTRFPVLLPAPAPQPGEFLRLLHREAASHPVFGAQCLGA